MTREEAIKGLTSLIEVRRKYFDMQTMRDEIEALDMAIKALEEKPKTGHWIHGHCGVDDYIKCSECHKEVVQNIVTLEGDLPEDAFSLCPFCGARMVEPQESEDK